MRRTLGVVVVNRLQGAALSRNPWITSGGSRSTAAESVAQMYEEIAESSLSSLRSLTAQARPAPVLAPVSATPAAVTVPARAADQNEFAPFPQTPVAPPDCIPVCRAGYFCHQGTCRSSCNPLCPAGEQCTAKGECVKASR